MIAKPSWFYYVRQFPRQTISMLFFLTLAGVVESVGAVSVLPLLGGLFGKDPADNPLQEKIHHYFMDVGMQPTLGNFLLVICAAMVIKAFLTLVAYQQTGYVEVEISTRLRNELLDRLLRADWSYFISQSSGRLTFALSTEATQAGIALRTICQALSQMIQSLSYLAAGLFISWEIMLGAILVGGLFFALFRGLIHYVRKAGRRQADALNAMNAYFTDALAGAKPLKVMAAEERFLKTIRALAERFKIAGQEYSLGSGLLATCQEPLLTILLAAGLYVSKERLGLDEAMLVTVALFFHRLVSRLAGAQQSMQQYAFKEPLLLSLLGKIDDVGRHHQPEPSGLKVLLREGVALNGVRFRYGGAVVMENLSLTISYGAITALFGASGSGKTTVTDLITGLARPEAGTITVDGTPLESLDMRAWREQIGYVPQEVFLLNDTVRNNLLIGREYPDEQVWTALDMAGARSFVEANPLGLDAPVGEQGRALSGGQRQRLMIARAVIGRPRLLIMDEATSGLDPQTTDEIMGIVSALKRDMAVLIVSHQESVRSVADQVLELATPADHTATSSSG